jgi:hypothetical protein
MISLSRKIGWCIVLAWSLTGFGCSLFAPREQQATPAKPPPDPGAPLQIPNPPATPSGPAGPIASSKSANPPVAALPAATNVTSNSANSSPAGSSDLPAGVSQRATLLPPLTNPLAPVLEDRMVPHPAGNQVFGSLYRAAMQRHAATPAYYALFHRRELADGVERPEELILFKYRKEPASIYMCWQGKESKNRELIYVQGQHGSMLHVAPGPGDSLLGGMTNRQVILRPDTPHGLGKERYPVVETGIGALIERFGKLVEAHDRGAPIGTLKYLDKVKRPEADVPLETVLHVFGPGVDPTLPQGGQRLWFFDPDLHFPILVIAHDAQKREAEYYFYDKLLFPSRVPEETFNPATIGRK